jgi:hypothetical protein
MMSQELIGQELTQEQIEADAAAEASGLGAIYQPMLEAKRAKQAKRGNRKKVDRRFKTSDDGEVCASPRSKSSDPWDGPSIDSEERFRLVNIIRSNETPGPGAGVFVMRPNVNLDAMFDEIFEDRERTPANLLRLYMFTRLRDKNGFPALPGCPVLDLVRTILDKEGLFPPAEKPVVVFERYVFPDDATQEAK